MARADGFKLKAAVIIPRARPIKALERFNNLAIFYRPEGSWMDETLVQKYLSEQIGHAIFGGTRLLVWNSFIPHYSTTSKNVAKKLNIEMAIFPGGCTKYLQPADVCWNKPFKTNVCKFYQD